MIDRDDILDTIRWSLCAAAILLLHGGAAYAIVNWQDPVDDMPPAGSIAVELEALPVSTTEEVTDLAPAPSQIQSEAETAQPVVPPEEPEIEVPQALNPEVAVTASIPKEIVEEKKEEEKPVEIRKKQEKERTPAPTTTAPQAQKKVAKRDAAPAQAMPSAASASALASWRSRLFAHLNAHKRPNNDRGTAVLSFTVDANGRVLGSSIARSSGSSSLDQDALALIRRANPVPPPPPGSGTRISIVLPVLYNSR
jgi:protein TonB